MVRYLILVVFSIFASSSFAQTLAQVGSAKISKAEFEKSYKQAVANSQTLAVKPTRKQHLEDMVRFKLGLLEASKTNLKANPAVKKALELELYKGLLEVNLSKQVNKIKVSDNEMKAYYRRNPQMRSSHIFVRLPENPNKTQIAEAKKRADKIYSDVRTGKKKWEVYVRSYSDDDATKPLNGDLGYHGKTSLYPTYYKALKTLKMGQVSSPTRGLYGFHIIKKTGQYSYDRSDKNVTKIAIFSEKRTKILNRYFEKLKGKHKVSYNKDAL